MNKSTLKGDINRKIDNLRRMQIESLNKGDKRAYQSMAHQLAGISFVVSKLAKYGLMMIILLMPMVLACSDLDSTLGICNSQHFYIDKTFYEGLKTCQFYQNTSFNYLTAMISYNIGQGDTRPLNNQSCAGSSDLFARTTIAYGLDNDRCQHNFDEYGSTLDIGTCAQSRYVFPIYILHCSIDCDASTPSVDFTYSTGCSENYNPATGDYSWNFANGRTDCYRYTTAYKCSYPMSMYGKNITIKSGCTIAVSKYYQMPPTGTTFLNGNVHSEYVGMTKGMQRSPYTAAAWLTEVFGRELDFSNLDAVNDYATMTITIGDGNFHIPWNITNVTHVDINYNDTSDDSVPAAPDDGQGNIGTENDQSALDKIDEINGVMMQSVNKYAFLYGMLRIAVAIFNFIVLLFYIVEIYVMVFFFFKWIPSAIFSMSDIIKKIVRGK